MCSDRGHVPLVTHCVVQFGLHLYELLEQRVVELELVDDAAQDEGPYVPHLLLHYLHPYCVVFHMQDLHRVAEVASIVGRWFFLFLAFKGINSVDN